MIASALMVFVVGFFLTSMESANRHSKWAEVRAEAMDRLQRTAARFSKDARQASGVDTAGDDSVVLRTLVGGVPTNVTWQLVDAGDGLHNLQRVSGTTSELFVVQVTGVAPFYYYDLQTDLTQVNRVRLRLATQPDPKHPPIEVISSVEMRNAS